MVRLFFDGSWHDLTKFVDLRSVSVNKAGDKTFSNASFKINQIKHLAGIDVSRPFPRFSRVKIRDDEFVVATDSVIDLGGVYSHEVECSSLEKIAADTTNAGLTITQPAGDIGLYYRSFSVATPATIKNANKTEITLDALEQSIDTSEIENQTMKKNKKYTISFTGIFSTKTGWVDLAVPTHYILDVMIEVNGVLQEKRTLSVKKRPFGIGRIEKSKANIKFEYENTGTNEVKVYVKAQELPQEVGYNYDYEEVKLTIATNEHPEVQKIMLDEVMEKVLWNDANPQRYYLSDDARAILSEMPSYEWTFSESYLWLQITQIADYIKAFPKFEYARIYKKSLKMLDYNGTNPTLMNYDFELTQLYVSPSLLLFNLEHRKYHLRPTGSIIRVKQVAINRYCFIEVIATDMGEQLELSITPFDDYDEYIPIGVQGSGSQATIDDYAAGLELNAENVYNEHNELYETTTLRAGEGVGLFSTDDIYIPTTQPIGEILDFYVRVPATITVGSITKNKGDMLRIDLDRILRYEYYQTLDSMADYSGAGRFEYSKNNCLYYKHGEKGVHGLAFEGLTTKDMVLTTTHIRGIYELIIAQLTRDNGDDGLDYSTTYDTGTVERDNEIAVNIRYRPYTKTNATIFKSDQTGFQFTTTKFLNDNVGINSPEKLGDYAQGVADRSGGTLHSFDGMCLYEELPEVLTRWGDKVLFGVSFNFLSWEKVSYSLQYIKDYVFISSYESYNLKERVYEIPTDNVVDRVIRKNDQIMFGVEKRESKFDCGVFVDHLQAEWRYDVPNWATLKHDNIETALSCVSQAVGRVVEFRVGMKDNYSAGVAKYDGGGFTYQKDVPYTDPFGRVRNTRVDFGQLAPPGTIAKMNALPINTLGTIIEPYGVIEFTENKDARERSVYSYQVAYLSENNAIIIYDGIAKFANVVHTTLRDIIWVEVSELPNRHAKVIDQATIIREVNVNIDKNERKIEIDNIGENAVVCYDRNSLELIMGDERKILNREIYYRGKHK